MPLVVNVESADIMATLVSLKEEFEVTTRNHHLKLTFSGAAEAHILAEEIARANISVILTSPRSYPFTWEQRRMYVSFILFLFFFWCLEVVNIHRRLPGPPLSKHSSVGALLEKGVNVAIGVVDSSAARNTRFEIAWVKFFFCLVPP